MKKTRRLRQRTRQALLISMFLLFPIIMNYMSPYVIIDGASQGVINGSLIVFGLMFISSLFVGRLWCGWLCPMGGLAEICFAVNATPIRSKKIDWLKWGIWGVWLAVIIWAVISAGGYQSVNFTLDTINGISVAGDAERPIVFAYIIYYMVIGIFLTLSLVIGKRAGCHSICWMAPFMMTGRKLRNLIGYPSLRLKADPDTCTNCKTCTANCPMSLDVNAMVQLGHMENSECILCGSCVDGCPSKSIRYSFTSGK
jgi:ferredoxin-type protein NapH